MFLSHTIIQEIIKITKMKTERNKHEHKLNKQSIEKWREELTPFLEAFAPVRATGQPTLQLQLFRLLFHHPATWIIPPWALQSERTNLVLTIKADKAGKNNGNNTWWSTSIISRIVAPSLVTVTSLSGDTIILSMPFGPKYWIIMIYFFYSILTSYYLSKCN